ncbi:MAG: dienelactone hydrolase family protein [Planctomycetota bacterium]
MEHLARTTPLSVRRLSLSAAAVLASLVAGCACTCDEPASEPLADADPHAREVWTGAIDEASFKALHELRNDQAPPALGKDVKLSDGSTAYVSEAGDGFPGIVVIHEWWGLNDHIRHWADRLAASGYNAIAVDLYGGEVATTPDGAMNLMGSVDDLRATETLAAAAKYLTEQLHAPKYGSIGWCFGGGWSLRTAVAQPDLDACVLFYGRPITDAELLKTVRAPLLGIFGDQDTSIPPSAVDALDAALTEAGVEHTILRYDAPHAFANPSSGRYVQSAAEAAWSEVQEFLAKELR